MEHRGYPGLASFLAGAGFALAATGLALVALGEADRLWGLDSRLGWWITGASVTCLFTSLAVAP